MTQKISEVQIVPVKPTNGLVGFGSFVLNDYLYLGGIGIYTCSNGGYRLTYPTRKSSSGSINLFHPINKSFAQEIEDAVLARFQEVTKEIYNMQQAVL